MPDAYVIAATLRAIRANLNLTQKQLAERLGVSFATVNRWEGGANMPQKAARTTIAALAAEAGVEMAEMGADTTEAAAQVTSYSPLETALSQNSCFTRFAISTFPPAATIVTTRS